LYFYWNKKRFCFEGVEAETRIWKGDKTRIAEVIRIALTGKDLNDDPAPQKGRKP
jgi:hypothetical protein